jgi:hypothetical protein
MFSTYFFKKLNFIKFRPVRAELFLVDERTDMTKLPVAFRSFASAPKDVYITDEVCHISGEGVDCDLG